MIGGLLHPRPWSRRLHFHLSGIFRGTRDALLALRVESSVENLKEDQILKTFNVVKNIAVWAAVMSLSVGASAQHKTSGGSSGGSSSSSGSSGGSSSGSSG